MIACIQAYNLRYQGSIYLFIPLISASFRQFRYGYIKLTKMEASSSWV